VKKNPKKRKLDEISKEESKKDENGEKKPMNKEIAQ